MAVWNSGKHCTAFCHVKHSDWVWCELSDKICTTPLCLYRVRNTVDRQSSAVSATCCVLLQLYEVNISIATGEKHVTKFTRWFKYDRDKLWLVYTQIVPVIFEPPCNTNVFLQVVYSHDLSRVVQWLLKIGTPDLRAAIIEELMSHVPVMLQSKYACFCVKRMLKHGTHNSRRSIIRSLHGKVVKLASHSVSFHIVYTVSWKNVGTCFNLIYGVTLYERGI
jgi:hypothetical protein